MISLNVYVRCVSVLNSLSLSCYKLQIVCVCVQTQGQVFAGSEFGAVQMPVSNCSRYDTCVDCILARDPYCAWDLSWKECSSVYSSSSTLNTAVQSLKEGDVSKCPQPGMFHHGSWFVQPIWPAVVITSIHWPCAWVCFRSCSGGGHYPGSREQHPAALSAPLQLGASAVAVFWPRASLQQQILHLQSGPAHPECIWIRCWPVHMWLGRVDPQQNIQPDCGGLSLRALLWLRSGGQCYSRQRGDRFLRLSSQCGPRARHWGPAVPWESKWQEQGNTVRGSCSSAVVAFSLPDGVHILDRYSRTFEMFQACAEL